MKLREIFVKIGLFCGLLAVLGGLAAAQTAPKQEQLLNGLKILMWPDRNTDKVTVRIRIHAGAAFDPQGKEGTMQLLADNLFPNAAAKEFFAEDLGGGLEIVTTYDYIQINASSKPDQFLTMLETLASAVANPPIDKETTETLKAALVARLTTVELDPNYVADRAVANRLLGKFPYGRPVMGTQASVQSLVTADLIEARRRLLTADNATVTISGNFDRSLAFKAARRYFGSWLKSDRRVPSTFEQPADPPSGAATVASPKQGVAALRGSLRGTSRGAKDFYASQIFTKVLETRLRTRINAAEALFVRNEAYIQPGSIIIGLAFSGEDAGKGFSGLASNDMVLTALNDVITDAEFQTARSVAALEWSKREVEESWLDADTYKLTSAASDRTAFDRVTLTDVRDFSDRIRKNPLAIILVNTPAS